MTDKELHRLRRQDLLELLIAQSRETERAKQNLTDTETTLHIMQADFDRLKDKLNDKDEQIERLKDRLNDKDEQMEHLKSKLNDKDEQLERLKARLNDKDAQIEHLQENRRIALETSGSIAEAALKINEIFAVAQAAADQYLYNLRVQNGDEE